MTSGNHLIRRIESACGETGDRNRWDVYYHVPLRLFHLRTAIELLHAFIRQNVHPLTATTFGDWLSPRVQVQYHKFRTVTIGLDDYNCLITAMVESRLQCYAIFPKIPNGRIPCFFIADLFLCLICLGPVWIEPKLAGKRCISQEMWSTRHIELSTYQQQQRRYVELNI